MTVAPFKWSDLGRFRHTGAKVDHNLHGEGHIGGLHYSSLHKMRENISPEFYASTVLQ